MAVSTIGLWSDLDNQEIRDVLRVLGLDQLPVRYLDGTGVPDRFKVRQVEGEPVPMNVLAEMQRLEVEHPMAGAASVTGERPWRARDRMLREMN